MKKPSKKPQPTGSTKRPTPATPKPGAGAKGSKAIEMSPIARQVLENARNRSPLDAASIKNLPKRQVEAIRQFAVALAESELRTDEDLVLICNRITEPPAVPLADLRYDTCRWCEAEIYYDRLMPSPKDLVRVCVPCGIMLLDADKKGRN
jgi:hypothetical protein